MSEMNTIRMTTAQLKELRETMNQSEDETAVFLLAGVYENKVGIHFIVRQIVTPREEHYNDRNRYHIEVSPIFFNNVIGLAEANKVTVIQCHSHPGAEQLQYSFSDNLGESASAKTLYDCLFGKPMGSLLFGKEKIIGRVWTKPGKKTTTAS